MGTLRLGFVEYLLHFRLSCHIYRNARLEFHSKLILVYGNLVNQLLDKLVIILGYSGGLLPKESSHVLNLLRSSSRPAIQMFSEFDEVEKAGWM